MSNPLPHDIAIEEAILGRLLVAPHDIAEVATRVGSADFYKPSHGSMFGLLVEAWRTGEPHSIASLSSSSDGLLTYTEASRLALDAPAGCKRACERLIELRIRRDLVLAGSEIMTVAREGSLDALAAKDQAMDLVSNIDAPTTEPRDAWDLDDFLNQPDSDTPWVIPGLFKTGWRAMIVASEGAGKTVLSSQIATAAAAGCHPFMPSDPITPIPTMIVNLENPSDAVKAMGRRMQKAAGAAWGRERVTLWQRPGGINIRRRHDRSELEGLLQRRRPQFVTIGPLYKLYALGPREIDETAAAEVQNILDDLRTRFAFALLIEHHAPKADGTIRTMSPYGSSLWLRWPELGLKLTPNKDGGGPSKTRYDVGTWRENRVRTRWPQRISHGMHWPWLGEWDDPYQKADVPSGLDF